MESSLGGGPCGESGIDSALVIYTVISRRFSSLLASLISSQITASAWRRVSIARKVISSGWPMGMATMDSFGFDGIFYNPGVV